VLRGQRLERLRRDERELVPLIARGAEGAAPVEVAVAAQAAPRDRLGALDRHARRLGRGRHVDALDHPGGPRAVREPPGREGGVERGEHERAARRAQRGAVIRRVVDHVGRSAEHDDVVRGAVALDGGDPEPAAGQLRRRHCAQVARGQPLLPAGERRPGRRPLPLLLEQGQQAGGERAVGAFGALGERAHGAPKSDDRRGSAARR
jgi:hypothetical protein